MNKENIPVITDREKLYDKCENMEQLFGKYYLPLLDKHYSKTYELQQENKQLKEQLLVVQTNEETYRLEMQEITKILGLSEDSLFDDVKKYARKLENQQKEFINYLEEQINKWHYNYDSNTYEYELEEPTAEELLETALSKYKEITGQAITTDRLEDYCDYNFEMIENTIAKIALNQKKIIERLNDVKKEKKNIQR